MQPLVPVVAGIVVATRFEPSFHMVGFAAAAGATGARSLKAVIQARTCLPLMLASMCLGLWPHPTGQAVCTLNMYITQASEHSVG